MKYNLVPPDDSVLHTKLEDFNFSEPPIDPKELSEDLHKIMKEQGGIGLAANQLGLEYRVAVFNTEPALTMYNPEIVFYNDEYTVKEEGCLSRPGFFVKVRRSDRVRVRYQDVNGQPQAQVFTGLTARVVQHEVDHLNGIDYLDRASKHHVAQAKRKMQIIKRKMKKLEKLEKMSGLL